MIGESINSVVAVVILVPQNFVSESKKEVLECSE